MKSEKFTVLELLIVISIIVILIATLLPILISAKNKGIMISCVSSLKQVVTYSMNYAADYDGWQPRTRGLAPDPAIWWESPLMEHAFPQKKMKADAFRRVFVNGTLRKDLLEKHLHKSGFVCPWFPGKWENIATATYVRNLYFFSTPDNPYFSWPRFEKVPCPSKVIFYGEKNAIDIGGTGWYGPPDGVITDTTLGMIHDNRKKTFAWIDGHISIQTYDLYTFDPYRRNGAQDVWTSSK